MEIGRFHGYDEPHIFPGPNADYLTGHAGAVGVLHALYLRSHQGGSYVTQCALLVANIQMKSYGMYTQEQQEALKARHKDLIGHMRYYDEIVAHGKKRHIVKGFQADRSFDQAFRKKSYQSVDGNMWGGLGDIELVKLALEFTHGDAATDTPAMRTDWTVGPCPPGYHLPEWELKLNPDFVPIDTAEFVQS